MIPLFFLDITSWNYNTLFQVKVSLVLLQTDLDLMRNHTERPNLTNCDTLSQDPLKHVVSRSFMQVKTVNNYYIRLMTDFKYEFNTK
jgi:hypothetical protein